eukprot:s859_g4.t1
MAPAVPSLRVQQLEKLQRRQSLELEQMLLNASKESSRRTPRPSSARGKATTAGVCRSGGERSAARPAANSSSTRAPRRRAQSSSMQQPSPRGSSPRQHDRSADVPPELIAGIGSVALAFHLHATCGGHWCGVSQALGKGTTSDQPPLSESEISRLEEELVQVRIQMFKKLSRVLVHCAFGTVLVFMVEFAWEPNTYSATLLALAFLTYVIYHLVNTGRVDVTDRLLRPLCPVLNGIIMTALVASAYVSRDEREPWHLVLVVSVAAVVVVVMVAQVIVAVVAFSECGATMAISICYAISFSWSMAVTNGWTAISPLFLLQQAFQAAIGIMVPGFVEFALRERIVASIRSKDSDSLIFGFRQMLKGICDGEPRSPSGRVVKVDVCHVLLPQLYGRKELHHLLSLTEDTESRQPEAMALKQAEAQLELFRKVRGAYSASQSAGSVSSCETFIESCEELAEMTLVLNGSTELIDIEEAHFRFHRESSAQKLGLGMPTLKRFARPLDWQGFSSFLRRYARQVAKGKSPTEQSMNGITLRLPSDSKKHIIARQGTLSSPFARNVPSDPVHLILQLTDFRGERPQEVHSRLEGVDELRSPRSHRSRQSQERHLRFADDDEVQSLRSLRTGETGPGHAPALVPGSKLAQEIFMALDSLPTATAAASQSVKAAKEGFLRLFSELATVQGRLEKQLKLKQELQAALARQGGPECLRGQLQEAKKSYEEHIHVLSAAERSARSAAKGSSQERHLDDFQLWADKHEKQAAALRQCAVPAKEATPSPHRDLFAEAVKTTER